MADAKSVEDVSDQASFAGDDDAFETTSSNGQEYDEAAKVTQDKKEDAEEDDIYQKSGEDKDEGSEVSEEDNDEGSQGSKEEDDGSSQTGSESSSEAAIKPHRTGVEVDEPVEEDAEIGFDGIFPTQSVVAIHGVHGQSRESWCSPPPEPAGNTWLSTVFSAVAPKKARVILYGYDKTEEKGGCYTLPGVYKEAQNLLLKLVELRTQEVMLLILVSKNQPKFPDLFHSIRGLVFFGYPHRSFSNNDLEEQLYALLSVRDELYQYGNVMRLTKSLSETILEVNEDFLQTQWMTQAIIVNIRSSSEDFTKRVSETGSNVVIIPRLIISIKVFEESAAITGAPSESRMTINRPHQEITHGERAANILTSVLNRDWLVTEIPPDRVDALNQLLNQAAPIFPWSEDEGCDDLKELVDLTKSNANQILHVRCPQQTALTSTRIVRYLDDLEHRKYFQELHYFQFDSRNVHAMSIDNMIWTYLAQTAFQRPADMGLYTKTIISWLHDRKNLSRSDLYDAWEWYRSNGTVIDSIHVFGCMDECDESALWFLSQLRSFFSRFESFVKIIVVTTKGTVNDELIAEEIAKFPEESRSSSEYDKSNIEPIQIDLETSMLLQANPLLADGSLRGELTELLSNLKSDVRLSQVVIEWLKHEADPGTSIELLREKSKTPTPEIIFETILERMCSQRREWANQLLAWMLSSLRPLKTFEFFYVSDMAEGREVANLMYRGHPTVRARLTEVLRNFGGLLVSVHGEIRFGHPAVRGWLESSTSDDMTSEAVKPWYRQLSKEEQQVAILKMCLKHMTAETESIDAWFAQLPYAVQFWPSHYKEVLPLQDKPDLKQVDAIFEKETLFKRWVEGYTNLSTPSARPACTNQSPLSYAAHFGLEGIVRKLLDSSDDDVVKGRALVEAARASELSSVKAIFESYSSPLHFDDEDLHHAVKAAAFGEDQELFLYLVDRIPAPPYPIPDRKQAAAASSEPEASDQDDVAQKEEDDRRVNEGDETHEGSSQKEGDGQKISKEDDAQYESPVNEESADKDTEDGNSVTQSASDQKSEPHDPFHWVTEVLRGACIRGNNDIIRKLLALGADPDPNAEKLTDRIKPLSEAVSRLYIDTVNLLVDAGANPNSKLLKNSTSLHIASLGGFSKVVTALLERGASIDAARGDGRMPLHVACHVGAYDVVETLLRHRDIKEYIPPEPVLIVAAVADGRFKIAESLLRHGADPDVPDDTGETALWWAINLRRMDLVKLLLDYNADPNFMAAQLPTPLILAVMGKNLDIIKLLVEKGADIEKKEIPGNGQERTPIHVALYLDQPDIVQFFLDKGAKVDVLDSYGWNALSSVTHWGFTDLVRMLLEAGANVRSTSTDKNLTPLHIAKDDVDVVRLLLEYGADLNQLSEDDETAFDWAILKNRPKTVNFILNEAEVKPDVNFTSTQRALRFAVVSGWTDIVAMLLEAGANVDTADDNNRTLLSLALPSADEAMVRTVMEYRPNTEIRDKNDNTAIQYVSDVTPLASVRLIVNSGAKIDTVNKYKYTILNSAVWDRNVDVMEYLLKKKVLVDTLNATPIDYGATPLHVACYRGTLKMVEMLIDKGSDVNFACSGRYGTPLMATTLRWIDEEGESQHEEIIKLLLAKGADPTIRAGIFESPIISASLYCPTDVIGLFLKDTTAKDDTTKDNASKDDASVDISVDIRDAFGRKPVHLACYNSLDVLELLKVPDSDFTARDIVGRVPLHYAVLGGHVDMIEEVLIRSERVGIGLEVEDNDGWTPLLWAARSSFAWPWNKEWTPLGHEVKLILENGANIDKTAYGPYKDWTALEIAYYHDKDGKVSGVLEKHVAVEKRPRGALKRGEQAENSFCECCLLDIAGIYFDCKTCPAIALCFKCYRAKDKIHPQHEFKEVGYDWDEDVAGEDEEPGSAVPKGLETVLEEEEEADEFDDEIVGEDDTGTLRQSSEEGGENDEKNEKEVKGSSPSPERSQQG
ncbi:hypothetical protein FSARC_5017 [Fusarium sarcochroum]|uniref:Ankyrin 1 n=1 Tax=Fusarium sarcochroum TaxID=1208366 RepID=A0A8H4XAV8_9HYPO|nr:hypothetical protein FSARC_5017 [Fusarium sarcochroum]